MNTWLVWRALQNKGYRYSPYWRILVVKNLPDEPESLPLKFARNTLAITTTLICSVFCVFVIFDPVLLTSLCFVPVAFVFIGAFSGLVIAIKTAGATAYEYEQRRYELTAVTPTGHPGVSWAICSEVYHHSDLLGQIRGLMRDIYPAFLVISFVLLGIMVLVAGVFLPMIWLMAIALSIYIDYVQSSVMGAVIGMLVPTYVQERLTSQVYALGAYLAVQMLFYVFTILISLLLIPALFGSLALLPVLHLLAFYGLREALSQALWRLLAQRLQGDVHDLNRIISNYTQTPDAQAPLIHPL